MKLFLFLALAILGSANAGEVIDPEHNYIYIPDDEGNVYLVDLLEEGEDLTGYTTDSTVLSRNVDTITFNLFTNDNPTTAQLLVLNSVSSVEESNFLATRPTRFITHGWKSSQTSDACTVIRDAYLTEGDYNVIVIDWSSIASALYVSAAPSVKGVAARVALMIDFLESNAGLDVSTTKLIGHSLGGHVAGIAARLASGTIQSVVGLDPALPLFNSAGAGSRIHQTDAEWVQVIHTNGGFLGLMDAVGDIDFYPNGGSRQPGCGIDAVGSCAHSRAYYYFAESIGNPTGFKATGQQSYYIESLDGSIDVYMGGRTFSDHAQGSFTLNTARSSPYALG